MVNSQLVSKADAETILIESLGRWSAGPGPLYQRLTDALRAALDHGVPAGALLPPERRLAELLRISRTTVVAAYQVLRNEGRIESRRGSGTRVIVPARESQPASGPALASAETFRSLIDRDSEAMDFASSRIGADGILTRELRARAEADLSALIGSVGYFPYGLPALRQAIARHLCAHGTPTEDNQILVTNGAQQAITLLAQFLASRGGSVVVENPTYAGAIDAFAATGARVLGIPVHEGEDSLQAVRRLIRRERPRLCYLMPTFQNPTGNVATSPRRQQLAALAAEQKVPLIEDNALASLAIGPVAAPDIAAFDRHGIVITIGSLSKTAWAGLRIGWIRADPKLVSRLVMVKSVADLGSSLPSQALAIAVLNDFARIADIRSAQLRDSLALTCRLLHERLPAWRFAEPSGGYSLWVQLPGGDGNAFARVALKHGAVIVPGSRLSPDGSFRDHIRLLFLQPPGQIEEGIRRLSRAWEEYTGAGSQNLGVVV